MEFESPEEATRAVAALDRQPLLPEASKRFVRLEQVRHHASSQNSLGYAVLSAAPQLMWSAAGARPAARWLWQRGRFSHVAAHTEWIPCR